MAESDMGASTVAGVVLAAGRSSRLTGAVPKQLLDFGGEPLICRAVRTALASRLAEVVVVVGHCKDLVTEAYSGLLGKASKAKTVYNSAYTAGQSTSIRCGLGAVSSHMTAAVFLPADQPFLTAALIDRLISTHEAGASIALPMAEGQRGAPVLFARRFFSSLEKLTGDTGGRSILKPNAREIQEVQANPRELMDLDTAEDLQRLNELATES